MVRLAEEAQRQTEILQNQTHLALAAEKVSAIAAIAEKIQSVVNTAPNCDFTFNKKPGLFIYTSGQDTQTMSVMDIRQVKNVKEGPTATSTYSESGGFRTFSTTVSNRDPDGLYISTDKYAKLVRKARNGNETWLPFVYINEVPFTDQEKLRQLFEEIKKVITSP